MKPIKSSDKIFISIASYRDPELIPTILDCIEKSDISSRLHLVYVYRILKILYIKLNILKNNIMLILLSIFMIGEIVMVLVGQDITYNKNYIIMKNIIYN